MMVLMIFLIILFISIFIIKPYLRLKLTKKVKIRITLRSERKTHELVSNVNLQLNTIPISGNLRGGSTPRFVEGNLNLFDYFDFNPSVILLPLNDPISLKIGSKLIQFSFNRHLESNEYVRSVPTRIIVQIKDLSIILDNDQ